MCSHYQAVTALERFERHFHTQPPAGSTRGDMWPTYPAAVVLASLGHRHAVFARWGLLANSARTLNPKLSTFNARSESVATSPTFSGAWAKGQRCIVPAEAIYEPDWRSGRHVPTRLQRVDGRPMGIAGLWDSWVAPTGGVTLSFTMLTINADAHPLMQHMHKPQDEKRMVVVLQESDYDAWLNPQPGTTVAVVAHLLHPYPADSLVATSEPSQAVIDNPALF
jgi:putative SOS response-associated peptidase YedK